MIGAGADRVHLVPLDTKGNRPADHLGVEGDVIGCHAGAYAGLNIENPQPGFEYYWALNPARGAHFDSSSMHEIHQRKGVIVKDGDPERAVYRHLVNELSPVDLDGNTVYNELCLVRVPVAAMREERRQQQELNDRRLRRGPEEAFVNQGAHSEHNYGSRGPVRFRLQDHHSEIHHDGRAEEIITPDSGVIRTERVT